MSEYLISVSIEFIAAFLGFMFALLLDSLLERRNKKEKLKLAMENIISELNDIYSGLNEYISKNCPISFKIQIPSWEALQYSGMTIELIEFDYYQELITTYSLIQYYNDSLMFQRLNVLSVEDIRKINENVNDLLNKMKGDIY